MHQRNIQGKSKHGKGRKEILPLPENWNILLLAPFVFLCTILPSIFEKKIFDLFLTKMHPSFFLSKWPELKVDQISRIFAYFAEVSSLGQKIKLIVRTFQEQFQCVSMKLKKIVSEFFLYVPRFWGEVRFFLSSSFFLPRGISTYWNTIFKTHDFNSWAEERK